MTTKATRQRRSNPGKPGKRLKLSKGVHLGNRTFNGAVPRCYVLSGGVIFVASIHGNIVRLRPLVPHCQALETCCRRELFRVPG